MPVPRRFSYLPGGPRRTAASTSESTRQPPHLEGSGAHRMQLGGEGAHTYGEIGRYSASAGPTAFLEKLLGLIEGPAFVVDDAGRILNANTSGGGVLSSDPLGIRLSLGRIVAGGSDPSWSLAPLLRDKHLQRFLAVYRPDPVIHPSAECTNSAKRRWRLTGRQQAVLDLVACGLTNADIADRLGIEQRTVEFHVSGIFDKVGVDNRATLLARLFEIRQVATSTVPGAKAKI